MRVMGGATENVRPRIGRAVINTRDTLRDTASHVNSDNIATGVAIVHEHVNTAASHAVAWAKDEENIKRVKEGAQVAAHEVNDPWPHFMILYTDEIKH